MTLQIKSIAIVGGGPSGLAVLNELIHTAKDGSTTIATGQLPKDPAFEKIVLFERNSDIGGVWNATHEADPDLPPQGVLGVHNIPAIIDPYPKFPSKEALSTATAEDPYLTLPESNLILWNKSGIYPNLNTNVQARFMRFSYTPHQESKVKRGIDPFILHTEVKQRLKAVADEYNLWDYIRLDSKIERAVQNLNHDGNGKKWVLTVRNYRKDGKHGWYQEQFDALVSTTGHYHLPYIPAVPGLAQFSHKYPGVVHHSKSFRDPTKYKDKRVLMVGNSRSGIDIVRYIYSEASQVVLSRRSENLGFPWLERAGNSEGIFSKPELQSINPETGQTTFVDGTIEDKFDHIIFATGYHYHYPFIRDKVEISTKYTFASSASRVKGLYLHVFSIGEPTLAVVGTIVTPLLFHSLESTAAAVAGVFSGAKTLPSVKEQLQWEAERLSQTSDTNKYHFYSAHRVKEDLVDHLIALAPHGRPNPLEVDQGGAEEYLASQDAAEVLFMRSKSQGWLLASQ